MSIPALPAALFWQAVRLTTSAAVIAACVVVLTPVLVLGATVVYLVFRSLVAPPRQDPPVSWRSMRSLHCVVLRHDDRPGFPVGRENAAATTGASKLTPRLLPTAPSLPCEASFSTTGCKLPPQMSPSCPKNTWCDSAQGSYNVTCVLCGTPDSHHFGSVRIARCSG